MSGIIPEGGRLGHVVGSTGREQALREATHHYGPDAAYDAAREISELASKLPREGGAVAVYLGASLPRTVFPSTLVYSTRTGWKFYL